jgi:hypothetical protein
MKLKYQALIELNHKLNQYFENNFKPNPDKPEPKKLVY